MNGGRGHRVQWPVHKLLCTHGTIYAYIAKLHWRMSHIPISRHRFSGTGRFRCAITCGLPVIQELTANSAVNFQQLVSDAEGRDTSARLRQGSRVSARLLTVPPRCRVSSDPQSCVPRCSLRSLFRQSECFKPGFSIRHNYRRLRGD